MQGGKVVIWGGFTNSWGKKHIKKTAFKKHIKKQRHYFAKKGPSSQSYGFSSSHVWIWVQFSSVAQSCLTLYDPKNCSSPGLTVHRQLPKFTQTHVYWVCDAIQPSHPLLLPSPPAFNLSQNQGLYQWVSSSHQVAKVLEFQLQYQSFQWIFRTDFL